MAIDNSLLQKVVTSMDFISKVITSTFIEHYIDLTKIMHQLVVLLKHYQLLSHQVQFKQ